jgi:hypothetical protein
VSLAQGAARTLYSTSKLYEARFQQGGKGIEMGSVFWGLVDGKLVEQERAMRQE